MASALLLLSLRVAQGLDENTTGASEIGEDGIIEVELELARLCTDDKFLKYLHFDANHGSTSFKDCSWVQEDYDVRCKLKAKKEKPNEKKVGRKGGLSDQKTPLILRDICPLACGLCPTAPLKLKPERNMDLLEAEFLTADLTVEEIKELDERRRRRKRNRKKKKKNRKPCPTCPNGEGHNDGDGDDRGNVDGDGDGDGDDDGDDNPQPQPGDGDGNGNGNGPGPQPQPQPGDGNGNGNDGVGSNTFAPSEVPRISDAPTISVSTLTTFSGTIATTMIDTPEETNQESQQESQQGTQKVTTAGTTAGTTDITSSASWTGTESGSWTGTESGSWTGTVSGTWSGSWTGTTSGTATDSTIPPAANIDALISGQESSVDKSSKNRMLAIFLSVVPLLLLLLLFSCCLLRKMKSAEEKEKGDDESTDDSDDGYPIHKTKSCDSLGSRILKVLGYFNGRQNDSRTDVHRCTSAVCDVCDNRPIQVMSLDSYNDDYAERYREEVDVEC